QHRVRPLSPFHFLDHLGVSLFDELPEPGEGLAPPITQLPDSRIDQLRGRVYSLSFLRAAHPLLHDAVAFFMVARPSLDRIAKQHPAGARALASSRHAIRAGQGFSGRCRRADSLSLLVSSCISTEPSAPRFSP